RGHLRRDLRVRDGRIRDGDVWRRDPQDAAAGLSARSRRPDGDDHRDVHRAGSVSVVHVRVEGLTGTGAERRMKRLVKSAALMGGLLAATVIVYAAASYPSSVKSFTVKTDGPGRTIFAAHINDLQDEITAIENGLVNGLAHVVKPQASATYD